MPIMAMRMMIELVNGSMLHPVRVMKHITCHRVQAFANKKNKCRFYEFPEDPSVSMCKMFQKPVNFRPGMQMD